MGKRLTPDFWWSGLLGYNWLRFGNWLETGYHFAAGQEGFTTPLW
jgi:hypothetical protein